MSNDMYLRVITEIASTGASGIPLRDVFEKHVPAPLVEFVWNRLKAARGDVLLYRGGDLVGHRDVLLLSYQSATEDGIHIKASLELFHAYLGIYGQDVQRFHYSGPQIKALYLARKAGSAGILSTQICSSLGLKGNNFGYVVQSLEERGKIFRRKAAARREDSAGPSPVFLVYLTQYESDVNAPAFNDTAQFQNDTLEYQKILDELEKSEVTTEAGEKVAIESHLKRALHFSGEKQGHKRWRRLRDKMIALHLIESFEGVTADRKDVNFIKKLKSSATEESLQVREQPSFHTPVRTLAHQVVELSMDRQFLIEIAKRGTEGATSSDLSEILGFNLKRHKNRFDDFEARFKGVENASISLNVHKTVVGRSSQRVYSITRSVAENILSASEALVGTDFCQQVLTKFREGQMPDDACASADEEDPAKMIYLNDSGQAYTKDFSYRLHWLVEIVKEKGLLLSMQASEYLLLKERERKGVEKAPNAIDSKQIKRIANVARKHNFLDIADVQVPNRSGVTGSQTVTVFLPRGVKMSEELLEKIFKVYTDMFKSKASNAAPAPATKPVVRGTFKKDIRPPQASSFSVYKKQKENGYHAYKLHRYEVLLECIIRMVESRPSDYISESFEHLLQTPNCEIRCTLEIPATKSVDENGEVKIQTQKIPVFKPTMESKRKVFTREQVWDALTVDEFSKALGAAAEDKVFLDSNRSKHVAELSQQDIIKISGGEGQATSAVVHLKKVLEMLTQLGVLKGIVQFSMSKDSRKSSHSDSSGDTGYYVLNDVAVLEIGDSTRKPLSPCTRGNPDACALESFDLGCPRARKGYWISLQYMHHCYKPKQGIDSNHSNLKKVYFPMDRTEKTFAKADRVAKNVEKVISEIDVDHTNKPMSWEQIYELAYRLDVPTDDVIHALVEVSRKQSRLDGFTEKKKSKPPKGRAKAQNAAMDEPSRANLIEEDEEELLLLHPESQRPPTRKRKWQNSEDRQLLYEWVRWLAANGVHSNIKWKAMLANILDGIKIGSYRNRLAKLSSDECVKEHMMDIKSEANKVYERHQTLKDQSGSKNKSRRFAGPNLFEFKVEEDLSSMQTILDKIERVVQEAPERPAEVFGTAPSRMDRFTKAYPTNSSPPQFLLWLGNYCTKAKCTSNNRQSPSIEVTCAMAAVLAALYEIEFLGRAAEEIKSALGSRFTSEVLKIACKNLVQSDLMVAERDAEEEASKGIYFALSNQFKVEMKPPFSPLTAIEDNKPLFTAEKGGLWPLPGDYSPLSVSPILALRVMGFAPFQITIPDDIQDALESFKSGEDSLLQLGQHCLERNMVFAHLEDPAVAKNVCQVSPVNCQPVLYQPKNLLESSDVYQKARKRFLKESKSVLGANLGNSILETVTNAGPNGITMLALQSVLELNNLSVESAVVGNLLQKYGLARIIRGYDETYVASAMVTGHLVSIKSPEVGATDAMDMDGPPSEQPLSESPLRPWMDSNGALIEPLWQSFVTRIVDVVCRFPGIDGEMLIQTLRSLPPGFAKEVITSLCQSNVLHFTTSPNNQRNRKTMDKGILSESFRYSLKNERTHLEDIFSISNSSDPFADDRQQPADHCFFVHPGKVLDAKNAIPQYICQM